MKKTHFLLALFTVSAFVVNGQTSGQVASYTATGADGGFTDAALQYVTGSIAGAQEKLSYENRSDIQGSPYTSNAFQYTTLYYDGEPVQNIFYRYNAYNEEIEIKQKNLENEPIRALGKDKKISILVNGQPLSFKTFIDKKGNTLNGYLLTLVEGEEYTLYKRINVKFTEGQKAQNSFVKAIPAKFSKFTEYYVEAKDVNRIDEIQLKNKKLLKLLPSDEKENLAGYLKQNDLNIKEEQDLRQVFVYLNS